MALCRGTRRVSSPLFASAGASSTSRTSQQVVVSCAPLAVTEHRRYTRRMKQKLRFWLGMLFSIAGLVLAIRATDLKETWLALGQTTYVALVPALAALGLTLVCKAARWRLLFDPRHPYPPLMKAFSVLIIGQMVNLIFPLRMGEVARAYYVGEMVGTSKSLAISTIVVEKVLDMLTVLALVLLIALSMPFPIWLQQPVRGLGIAAILLFAALVVMAHFRSLLLGLASRFFGSLPLVARPGFLREQAERALDGLRALKTAETMLPVVILTLAAWLTSAITNHFVFLALGVSLPFIASVFLVVVLQVGVAVPTGPGRIGVFQYITILALSLFAIPSDKALAIGVVLYLIVHIPPLIMGLFFLWQYHLSLWRPLPVTEES